MIKRRRSREIIVGGVKIGGLAPVSIQSMTKVKTSDVAKTVSQIKRLEACGCDIIRVAIKDAADADAVKAVKARINIPLVADIHFDYRLALKCIANGADKIRLNPGNIRKEEDVVKVIKSAKKAGIPIRIGVNSGSVLKNKGSYASGLVDAAMSYIKSFERNEFRDIIISLKASSVVTTVEAYRKMSELCDYPLHLGVTASGPYDYGVVKSSIGIGALLLDGIGDTIRVSLTADPVEEVMAAKRILSSLGARRFGPEIISCPTCGRCQVDLVKIARELENALTAYNLKLKATSPLKIALMGCEVNGPGEAMEADLGIAAGKSSGVLFVKGKIVRKVKSKDFVKELLKEMKKI